MLKAEQGERHDMVSWYHPALLLRMALRSVVAKTVGQIVDNREIQAALNPIRDDDPLRGAYDFSRPTDHEMSDHKPDDDAFWLDYVADIGDGWTSTHAVASQIAQATLDLDGVPEPLPRGNLLIMGGDEVYPEPSMQAYQERTLDAYRLACEQAEFRPMHSERRAPDQGKQHADSQRPGLFALPGNHDWYDGLHAFGNIFCQARGRSDESESYRIAAWQSCQSRSYFCIKLPHDWWLCGIDIQLGAGANTTQLDYFRDIARSNFKPTDRIILCCAKPEWLFADIGETDMMQSFGEFMQVLTPSGAQIRLILAGDVHHYSRYQSPRRKIQFVTAGGGGAFLHPTHKLPKMLKAGRKRGPGLDFKACYPPRETSRRLSNRLALFPFINPQFSLLIGTVYTLLAWVFEARTSSLGEPMSDTFMQWYAGHATLTEVLQIFFTAIPRSPEVALIVAAIYYAFIKFNLTRRRNLSLSLGIGHAMAHFIPFILSYFAASCVAFYFQDASVPLLDQLRPFLIFMASMLVLSTLLGGLVFGLYLWVALNVFGLHWTNSFSALRIAGYKNFIRIRFNSNGELTVYPLKIDQVSAPEAELIEPPFTIK